MVTAYQNPTVLPSVPWGIGDPYILKYNGVYYAYGTVSRNVNVWSSRDLIHWSDPTVCLTGGLNPYAPEVRYYDGEFYMYTAPDGGGHIIYTATAPTGPFTAATDNLGRKFDGTVMMDSDNTIYFVSPYQSGDGYMRLETMSDFKTIRTGTAKQLSTTVGGGRWTEGPTLFRRLGKYYMTYTGNHVWEASYHVEYALSDDPMGTWIEPADNKVLFDIEGAIKGPGHNSIFIGPDLDTYYITYHSIAEFIKDKSVRRQMNFDKIVWNGEKLVVQGPTSWEVDAPDFPAFYDYFDAGSTAAWTAEGSFAAGSGYVSTANGTLLSKQSTDAVFTAEYNLTLGSGSGTAYVLFAYKDAQNHGRVWIDQSTKALKAEILQNGVTVWSDSSALYSFFNYTVLHTVRVQQSSDTLRIVLDEVERIVTPQTGLAGGKIGYRTDGVSLQIGYTAFSHKALGSADHENYAPLPGTVEAVHYTNTAAALTKVKAAGGELGYAVELPTGSTVVYNVNVEKETTYSLGLSVAAVSADTVVKISVDGKAAAKATLPAVSASAYRTLPLRHMTLPQGEHQLSICVVSGSLELYEITASRDAQTAAVNGLLAEDLAGGRSGWLQFEQTPLWLGGTLQYSVGTPAFGKLLSGSLTDTDYTVAADITLASSNGSAGLLFRVTHADNGYNPARIVNNSTYHRGYFLGLSDGKVTLYKHDFGDWQTLKEVSCSTVVANETVRVKVAAVGDTFATYVNGTLLFTYTDTSHPLLTGRAGVRAHNAEVRFGNYQVTATSSLPETAYIREDGSTTVPHRP